MSRPIKIWLFWAAPQELRALSPHGGDEDWLALVPPELADSYIGWLESGTSFGCCEVSEHRLPHDDTYRWPGYLVKIGAHA